MAERQNRLAGARVLVVEDEFLIADDLVRALSRFGAEPIGPVGTITDALRALKKERPDAAILDLNLRGEVASGLVDKLAEDEVPCLIVSGYSERSFPDEFSHFPSLEKPVSYERVAEKLAQILEGARNPAD